LKAFKIIAIGFFAVSFACAFAQGGGKDIRPIPAELLAKCEKARQALLRGNAFLEKNQLADAIGAFQEAVAVERTYGYPVSTGSYQLAKALTAAGRASEALAAYKEAVRWDPIRKELTTNGPPQILLVMDYAILLAKSGKAEEAKSVYYFGLRHYNEYAEDAFEPIPFLIVFDADPTMTVWDYSSEKLVAAATMAKAPFMQSRRTQGLDLVRRMEPGWALPLVHIADSSPNKERPQLYKAAEDLALTTEEKAWIEAYRAGGSLAKVGFARRKESSVLRQAKLDLSVIHDKIAS